MKVMVTGNGGREHALAWKAMQSPNVDAVFVAPGNAGTALEPGIENVAIDVMDFDSQIAFAKENGIDLTLIGPEAPLVAGAVDRFEAAGLRCFGPSEAAAQLEGSKSFTKAFLARHNIPTAAYEVFDDVDAALANLHERGAPIVVKADGLAAGKGVVVAQTLPEAEAAVRDMLSGNAFGDAGARVVIEDCLIGEEASFIVIADGTSFIPFASSQDHKPIFDGDEGPNTGGMGAYSPAPVVTPEVHDRIVEQVIQPTIDGMANDGTPFRGFLYAGLMIDADGNPFVIEFNTRFGDPETQPIMMRLTSDLVELCGAAIDGDLSGRDISFTADAAVGVVVAAGGYPGDVRKGDRISGLDSVSEGKVFHAGTKMSGDDVVTNGGRIVCATALGTTVSEARDSAYRIVDSLSFDDMYARRDIAHRAVTREQAG